MRSLSERKRACRELRTVEANALERVGGQREQDGVSLWQPCQVSFKVEGLLHSISHCRELKEKQCELTI